MRLRLVVALGALAGTLLSLAGTAAADTGLQLMPVARLAFPQRAYVLEAPGSTAIDSSRIHISENGSAVHGIRVTPVSDAGSFSLGVVLAIDASNSMRGRPLDAAVQAARTFVARKPAPEQVGIVVFNGEVTVVRALTSSTRALEAALARPPALGEGTHIYDGLDKALSMLAARRVSSGSVVLLSDGSDVGSRSPAAQVIRRAERDHVRVFSVGLRSGAFDSSALEAVAARTDAAYAEAGSASQLATIYSGLGERLAGGYLLQYRSEAPKGTPVDVLIDVDGVGSATTSYTARASRPGPYHRSLWSSFMLSQMSAALLALVSAALLVLGAAGLLRRSRSTLVHRVSEFVSVKVDAPKRRDRKSSTVHLEDGAGTAVLTRRWWPKLVHDMEIAQIGITPAQLATFAALGTLVSMAALALVAPLLAAFGLAVPLVARSVVSRKLRRVRIAFDDQLPDALQVLASALRAGHSFVGSLAVVVQNSSDPMRRELQRVVTDEQLGVPLEESLRVVSERMANADLEQVALVAELQREVGGNAAEVLDTVVDTIRERFDLRRLVKTLTAQGRFARWILTFLPVVMAILLTLINPGYLTPLLTSFGGQVALVIAGLMVVAGSLIIQRIIEIEI